MSFDTMHYKDDINLRIEKYKQDRMRQEQPRATGIEAQVCYDIAKRQELGLKKYGVSLEENNLKLGNGYNTHMKKPSILLVI